MSHKNRRLTLERLEDRVLFDAVPDGNFFTAPEVEQPIVVQQSSIDLQDVDCDDCRSELIVIDGRVKDIGNYVNPIIEGAQGSTFEVKFIDTQTDGFGQVEDFLNESSRSYDAIHILSHGEPGQLELGSSRLSAGNFDHHASTIEGWAPFLSEEADLLFYGCELAGGPDGMELLDYLGEATGADISASDDLTGSNQLGGDWDLEIERGTIETAALQLTLWEGTLDLPTFDTEGIFHVHSPKSQLSMLEVSDSDDGLADMGDEAEKRWRVNGAGYRQADGYGYGITQGKDELIRIGGNGQYEWIGKVDGLPRVGGHYQGGDFANDLLYVNSKTHLYGINVETAVVEDVIEFSERLRRVNDIAFDAQTNQFYGLTTGRNPDLISIDLDGNVQKTEVNGIEKRRVFSSVAFDSEGNLIATDHRKGMVYSVDVQTATASRHADLGQRLKLGDGFSVHSLVDPSSNESSEQDNGGEGETENLSPPVASPDQFQTGSDSAVSGNLFAENGNGLDSDPENNAIEIVGVNSTDSGVGVSVQLNSGALVAVQSNGDFDYDPNQAFGNLQSGETATDSFTYTIFDGEYYSEATVTVTVEGADDPGPNASNDLFELDTNEIQTGNLMADNGNGVDLADGGVLSVVSVNGNDQIGSELTLASGALITVDSNGQFEYDPNGQFDDLYEGEQVTDLFYYTISDGDTTSTAIAEFRLNGVFNPAPEAASDEFATLAHTKVVANLFADNGNGVDSDLNGDTLQIVAVDNDAGNVGEYLLASGAKVTVGTNGDFVYDSQGVHNELPIGDTIVESFQYTVSDGQSEVTASVSITVEGVFDASEANVAPEEDVLNPEEDDEVNFVGLNDGTSTSIMNAGDFNNDGIEDYLVGDYDVNNGAGAAYLVYGSETESLNDFDVNSLYEANGGDGSRGFVVQGAIANDRLGEFVSNIGDINNDGITDIIVSATDADQGGLENTGAAYVIYGNEGLNRAELNVSSLYQINGSDGSFGFVINGSNEHDLFGTTAGAIGDVNGDGIDDFAISTIDAEVGEDQNAGKVYVYFGQDDFETEYQADFLSSENGGDGSEGFIINAISPHDHIGDQISGGVDVNGDRIDDFVVTAPNADGFDRHDSGKSFVVFGSTDGFDAEFELSSLLSENGGDGSEGMVIHGVDRNTGDGSKVQLVGDINGDAIGELVIGAGSEKAYVYYGGQENMKAEYVMKSLKQDGVYFDNLDPSLYVAEPRYMNNVDLQSTNQIAVRIWGSQTVQTFVQGESLEFEIGYGTGAITLSTGTEITWTITPHEGESWPQGKPIDYFAVDIVNSDNDLDFEFDSTVIDQVTELTDDELIEFAEELYKFRGSASDPLNFNG
ncbi:MAG: DUF4347 domain-containing protein [Planctomycetota bacterium]